jgi:hypothetical protein
MAFYADWEIADFCYISGNPPLYYSSPIFRRNIFVIKIINPLAKPTWKFAGWVELITIGHNLSSVQEIIVKQDKLLLGKSLFLEGNLGAEHHKIDISFPRWFTCAEITIWQSEEEAAKIDFKLNQIDFQKIIDKLDNLPDIALP